MKDSSCAQSKDKAPRPSRKGLFPSPAWPGVCHGLSAAAACLAGLPCGRCSRARFPLGALCSVCTLVGSGALTAPPRIAPEGLGCPKAPWCPHPAHPLGEVHWAPPLGPLEGPGTARGPAAASLGDQKPCAAAGRISHSSIVRQEETCLVNAAVTTLKRRNLILTTS